jgi:hypothetical protein
MTDDASFVRQIAALLQDEVVPWLRETEPVPDTAITGEWSLPEFEEVATVLATRDPDIGTRITVSLIRSGRILATIEWPPDDPSAP